MDNKIIRIKSENCSRQRDFEVSNWSFIGIARKGLVKRARYNENLTAGYIVLDLLSIRGIENQLKIISIVSLT